MISKKWLTAVFFDWVIVVLAICLSYFSYWFIPISILIIGNRQHALGILGHDGAHQLVCPRNKFLNDLITNIFVFYPFFISIKEYRKFHWDHHRNTNNDKDPEILLKATKPNSMEGPITLRKVVKHGLMDLMGFGIPHIVAFMFYIRPKKIRDSIPIFFVLLMSLFLIYSKNYLILVLWFVSLYTSFWFFFRLRVWTEHVGLDEGETLRFTPTMLEKILFLPHNTWLHYEHHEKPSVPFDKLPELRKDKFPKLRDLLKYE
jgi:fatty acid desaturase